MEAKNELSDDEYNFIALADNSGLDQAVTIDGVSEEASCYDPSIKINNSLDANAFNSSSNSAVNETSKGNHIIGMIANK